MSAFLPCDINKENDPKAISAIGMLQPVERHFSSGSGRSEISNRFHSAWLTFVHDWFIGLSAVQNRTGDVTRYVIIAFFKCVCIALLPGTMPTSSWILLRNALRCTPVKGIVKGGYSENVRLWGFMFHPNRGGLKSPQWVNIENSEARPT